VIDPGAWGIAGSYRDAWERRQRIPDASRRAVLAAMRIEGDGAPPPPAIVARPGQALATPGDVVLEDGTALGRLGALPPDVPTGYHHLDGRLLLVAPPRCHLPRGLRAWGWAVQLHATRSTLSWGHGDLADLAMLAATTTTQGGGFVTVSPTWAANPGAAIPEPSPYYPSSRRMHSPLYLRVEEVSGADALGTELVRLAAAGRALNGVPRIDRAAVAELKLHALRAIWEAADRPQVPEAFRAAIGPTLRRWATFAVLSEELGPRWRTWAADYRDPAAGAVARFATGHAARVAFHEWLQWQIDLQRARAGARTRIVTDLPIGADPEGFDAWDWQPQLADGATIGVPPDRFNASGQDWGLPTFVPHLARADDHRAFVETVRAGLRHAGGLRIDHVLGLFRMWWVPSGADPRDGAYVRYPVDELLAILAIESARAGAIIVGEDLGTVPRGVRSRLARANVLSTRLLYFERRPPATYPRRALASITTHDLPTLAGAWSGSDLADQAAAGLAPDAAGLALLRRRVAAAGGVAETADLATVALAAHRALAQSPAALVAATIEDAMQVERRPNIPGTVPPARDNWSTALPRPIESLRDDRFVAHLAETLRR
jgi:4-alpha-glucanotransferase